MGIECSPEHGHGAPEVAALARSHLLGDPRGPLEVHRAVASPGELQEPLLRRAGTEREGAAGEQALGLGRSRGGLLEPALAAEEPGQRDEARPAVPRLLPRPQPAGPVPAPPRTSRTWIAAAIVTLAVLLTVMAMRSC